MDSLVAATRRLLAYEDQLPALLDGPARALTVQVVRASGGLATVGVAATVVCVLRGVLGWGWYLAAAAGLLVAVTLLIVPVRPAGARHRLQRWSALAGAVLTLSLAPTGLWVDPWAGVLLTVAVLLNNGLFTGAFETQTAGSEG